MATRLRSTPRRSGCSVQYPSSYRSSRTLCAKRLNLNGFTSVLVIDAIRVGTKCPSDAAVNACIAWPPSIRIDVEHHERTFETGFVERLPKTESFQSPCEERDSRPRGSRYAS